ncbi:MAG: M48 family metallopeptidase, partial [Candidatus Sericytochromatia bacterium]
SATSCSREEIINRGIGAAIGAGVGLIQAQSLNPQTERQLGAQVRQQVLQEYKLYTASPALVEYVRSVGEKLATQAETRTDYDFQFEVIDSKEINAFTIPGGTIFVTTELLKYLHNEAELASVLGHEIGHIDGRHPKETLRRALIAQGAVQGGLSDQQILAAVAALTADLILRGFSREQEREADRRGVVLATKFNYDEKALTGFLNTLIEVEGKSPSGIVGLLLTHPGSEERIALLKSYIDQNHIHAVNPIVNAQAYQTAVSVLPPKQPLTASK